MDKQTTAHRNDLVVCGRVVCHTTARLLPFKMSNNYWSIYFLLAGDRSARFNMIGDESLVDFLWGVLDIRTHDYQLLTSTIRYLDYPVVRSFSIGALYEYLVEQIACHAFDVVRSEP